VESPRDPSAWLAAIDLVVHDQVVHRWAVDESHALATRLTSPEARDAAVRRMLSCALLTPVPTT
jgi:hypothetical protein